jgi:hypothetical protein
MASVQSYVAATAAELTLRKQQLSEERKRERRHEQALQDNRQKQALRKKQHTARTVQIFATSAACVLLVIGVLAEKYTSLNERITQEVAQVLTAVSAKNSEKISNREIVAPTEVEVLDFSQESVRLTSLNSDAVHEGILVLPSVASAKIPDLFSDDVTVVTDTHGQPHIVRLDEAGTVVEKVPYVVVPVKQNQP